ncbi:metallophosphoesterase [Hyphomicrobium sp.]|uniref:metallophosphoesterase family protein n=1 Tax=Hyphomicrobium sp. TaxID=82 RepID=UPI002D7848BA|nr:metallophosphoesterase [Hyphomicrobium sp.]HET6390026.1 metallophosphoesterase [Hyphomicrobium sp.]
MTETFTLAHFSDVHLPPAFGSGWRHWNAKRALGYVNWIRKRRRVHQGVIANMLLADAVALRVDHIAITGDLINLGLPSEYEAAHRWLKGIGPPENVTIVPGNHDIYSSLHGDLGVARWAEYMGGENETLAFPFVRRAGPVALVGLNSAVPTPPFVASGRLGAHQLEIAGEQLAKLGEEDTVRVVLIHHPPLPGLAPPRRALSDAAHFAHLLQRGDAELVLYGHNHVSRVDWVQSRSKSIPVVGVASASAGITHREEPLGCYNLFTFFKSETGLRIRHVVRGIDEASGEIKKISESVLTPSLP